MKARHTLAGRFATCLAATFLFTAGAHAQGSAASWQGFYVGGGGSYSNVSVEVNEGCFDYDCYWWGDYYDYDEGDGAYSYAVHAGYRFNQFVAAEANYFDTGTIRWEENLVYIPECQDYCNNHVEFTAQVAQLSVLGILPFAQRWEGYLRLGTSFWNGESRQRLDDPFSPAVIVAREVDDSGVGILFGLGIGVRLAQAWHARLDFQFFTIDEDVLNASDDTTLDSVLLELQYRFGARDAEIRPAGPATATP
jgi:hypothetical protein